MPTDRDIRLAEEAVKRRLITEDQSVECLKLLETADEEGLQGKLTDTFAQKGDVFAFDWVQDVQSIVSKATTTGMSADSAAGTADRCLELIAEAVLADRYDAALQMAAWLDSVVAKAADIGLIDRLKTWKTRLPELKKRAAALDPARKALERNPDDPDANKEVGAFQCFDKGDWRGGLPRLAKASDAALKTLAGKEMAEPKDADAQLQLADAWCTRNSGEVTHPVGQKKPNPWGLYDMYGNVWEFCSDWLEPYSGEAQTDPRGPLRGRDRVLRGGSCNAWSAGGCRSAARLGSAPDYGNTAGPWGFRVARSME